MLAIARLLSRCAPVLLLFAGACGGDESVDTTTDAATAESTVVEEIRHLEHQWADAIRTRDATTLDRLMAAGFELAGTDTTQPPVPRDVWMGNTLERLVVDSIRISPAEVVVRGDTADATMHFVWAGTFNAALAFHDSTMLTDRWIRGPSGWQVHRRTTAD